MKCVLLLLVAGGMAAGQTAGGTIAGTLVDARTQKPVAVAFVTAIKDGLPPLAKKTKSGADGAFRVDGLSAGKYVLCVQAAEQRYLDPCEWNGTPVKVTLASGQTAAVGVVRLALASMVTVQVQDAQNRLIQKTRDGRNPELSVGVWGPNGMYFPARVLARPAVTSGASGYTYGLAVPSGVALKLDVSSRDLRLGDGVGVALAGNSRQESFQIAAGDVSLKSFRFAVLGVLP